MGRQNVNRLPKVSWARTPDGKREAQRFMSDLEKQAKGIEKISVRVLIWGPGKGSPSPAARKRRELKVMLIRQHFFALFSEDIPPIGSGLTQKGQEFFHASSVDLIFLFMDSPGALAELSDFEPYHNITSKMVVFCPGDRNFQAGYAGTGILRILEADGRIHWYTREQLDACEVLTKAMETASAIREKMFLDQQVAKQSRRRRRG